MAAGQGYYSKGYFHINYWHDNYWVTQAAEGELSVQAYQKTNAARRRRLRPYFIVLPWIPWLLV